METNILHIIFDEICIDMPNFVSSFLCRTSLFSSSDESPADEKKIREEPTTTLGNSFVCASEDQNLLTFSSMENLSEDRSNQRSFRRNDQSIDPPEKLMCPHDQLNDQPLALATNQQPTIGDRSILLTNQLNASNDHLIRPYEQTIGCDDLFSSNDQLIRTNKDHLIRSSQLTTSRLDDQLISSVDQLVVPNNGFTFYSENTYPEWGISGTIV
jgi:hypothetical protein